ncbi:MAG: ATP-binding protein [Solirubrobacteraceae bacterium]
MPLHMYGLTIRELTGELGGRPFLQRLADADVDALMPPPDPPDLVGYVELALRGGFPEPVLRLSREGRGAWLEGYLEQLFGRDAAALHESRDPGRLRRYFEVLALNTAGVAESKTLYDAASIDRKTALAYERLLINLFVLEITPAWRANRLSRLTMAGKRYLVDPSLVAAALRLDAAAVMRDGDLLGCLIDTFAVAQIRPELELQPYKPRMHHLRARDGGHEVDVIVELPGGGIVAIEIKSTASPNADDARHLRWLRDRLGESFRAGAVLHTGPRAFRVSERIFAVPIASMWS